MFVLLWRCYFSFVEQVKKQYNNSVWLYYRVAEEVVDYMQSCPLTLIRNCLEFDTILKQVLLLFKNLLVTS